jgi:protein-tyrosine phosphatase
VLVSAYAGGVRLLFVCTGNLCRSPFAERRTRHLLGADSSCTTESAGTHAVVGEPMDERAAQVLGEFGGSAVGHRATPLSGPAVDGADLVLTMSTDQRTVVLERSPLSLHKTFTLLEAVGLLDLLEPGGDPSGRPPAEHLRAMVARLAHGRSMLPRPHRGFPDVPDPIGRPLDVHREVGRVIDEALRVLLPRLIPRTLVP